MDLVGVLYVEEGTEEADRAVGLMDLSGLPYQVIPLKKEEADERRMNCDPIPMLLSWSGFYRGLEAIEWCARCYGKGGPQHHASLEAERKIITFYSKLRQNPYAFCLHDV